MTQKKGLLVNWIIVAALMLLGVFFVFSSLSEFSDHSSYYWQSGRWTRNDDTTWAFFKFVMGIGFLIGGVIDMATIKNKAKELNTPVFVIPKEKKKQGTCSGCGVTGVVASCKLPRQSDSFDLCERCINKYKGQLL